MTKHDYPVNNRLDDREKAAVWQAISTPSADGRARRAPRRFGPAFAGLGMAAAVIAVVLLADWPQRTTQDLASRDHAPVQETVIVSVPPPDTAPEVPVRAEGEAVRRERTTPPPPRLIESVPAPQDIAARSNEKVEQYASDEASARPTPAEIPQDQLHLGGGRRGDVQAQFDGVLAEPAPAIGKVSREADAMHVAPPPASAESGGTANPNDRPYDLVYHEHYGVNPFVAAEDDALSTFAVDVDDASWAVARRYLRDGNLPPREAVRLEEFVNAFDPGWPAVAGGDDFAIRVDGAPSRFGDGYHLLRVGIQGREITAAQRRPADLVFVIDISGSMARENRLGLVKQALRILVDELREGDRVGIVVYGSEARVVLEPVGIERRTAILAAIDGLQTDGATNAEAGLRLAYGLARRGQDSQAINRLILCSDGVANVGDTGADSILASVRQEADRGIMLTTIGFGMGNYNDVLMEKLADQGDGTYHYVDRIEEAERVFRQNLTGTLQTLGRDAKVQVEFDPSAVDRWRLLGYENRDVADRDFRNDAVDAGEIGSGHTVVALYEVKLTDRGRDRDARLATVRFRWEHPRHDPRAGKVEEIEQRIDAGDLARKWQDAPPRLRLAGTVAEFAEILRGSFWAQDSALADLVPEADRLARDLEGDAQVLELRDLIREASALDR